MLNGLDLEWHSQTERIVSFSNGSDFEVSTDLNVRIWNRLPSLDRFIYKAFHRYKGHERNERALGLHCVELCDQTNSLVIVTYFLPFIF